MRIWVTRDEPPDGPLGTALRARGLRPVLEPVVRRQKVGDAAAELRSLTSNDWIVLTSAFAVTCIDLDAAKRARVAVVGASTSDAARQAGLKVEYVSTKANADALFDELRERIGPGTICYPRSSQAEVPPPWKGARIVAPIVYETAPVLFDRSIIDRVDAAAITSPSAINAIGPIELPLASIGTTTSAAIRRLGMKVWAEALKPSFESLAMAIGSRAKAHRREE